MGVDEAWKCKGCGKLIESLGSFSCCGGLDTKTGDLSATESPTGQPRPAANPSLTGTAELPRASPPVGGLMNPNDVIVGGNVEDGNALALEEAYAAPVRQHIQVTEQEIMTTNINININIIWVT